MIEFKPDERNRPVAPHTGVYGLKCQQGYYRAVGDRVHPTRVHGLKPASHPTRVRGLSSGPFTLK